MAETKDLPFEEAMRQLEWLVEKLEEGNVPLEQAIDMFKEGMDLSQSCHEKLLKVEKQLDQIMHEDGELVEANLEEEANE
ncbi:exodeoxyribonuclease VII small subunit [Shouchella clausii]|jgi:exodeoxyribonuclease VII small subunit|uniref:Exodeoxyribonuclease 7 small subunit n=3 Tax=Shouchella TaxID=2893057 RepID=EX7S_SHOC1|nr:MULTISPECIES: exodeoxyribonuclease VII small subunit [Shouchella]Q5WF61.1 RecName: Full=Exodeoxyribonuclease 7 small subunit; AltName: Full=Exodeoxyribonuclease VII small subunit; Short=Exonuclease VII small subunit [Shouchella clausii KSM-K16]MCM3313192.1 exodeoxyribonuclease VII small subunit [Psychrobacillus sp. MER TA 17]PAD40903.1 exodeoxyribonuclease 7 small subunit [Bacillus sp. 7520-S]SPU20723.1 exodeoxyribonuclease VII small subunit [Niallia circulans]ALA54631.1 Exodeoxyribonucleas